MKIKISQLREMVREEVSHLSEKEKKGLWHNIRKKRQQGKKPATPGDPDYPSKKVWDKLTKESTQELEEASTSFDKDKMKCNKKRYIRKGETGHGKKQKVVKACEKGKEKIVKFGDAKMRNNKDKKKNRKNFRSRMNCDKPGSKLKARYWACKDW
jgi:hypothetical protein